MRVLVIQNYRNTGLGQVGRALDEVKAEIDLRHAYLREDLPSDSSDHDALVILGGEQNALQDEDYPYFPALLGLVRNFGDAGKAVLGICLGSQLIARSYGGDNVLGRPTEFGWHLVKPLAEGFTDPVLSAVSGPFPIFHWHSDTFTLPEGAAHLASSEMTPHQAFRIGRAVYGIQFHFEADTGLVGEWNREFADYITENHPHWLPGFEAAVEQHGRAADRAGLALARAWVRRIDFV
ncbi:MAG: type 1 glutamine amidotransferase [Phyllobacterium sp.]